MKEEMKNSRNRFELEGNVARINEIYVNKNGKKTMRFDLGQNHKGNSQFVPIVIKGDWICVRGMINTYSKPVEKDGNTYNEKIVEILGFEIEDRTHNRLFKSNGEIKDLEVKEEMER